MYTKREFLVKVKKENYAELLRILGELKVSDDGLIEKNIYLPDTKETYELLVKSGLVEDWSPVEEKPTLVKRGFELKSVQEEEEDVVGSIPLFGGNNMILLIEYLANLTVYFLDTRKKSPGLRFTHAIFKREILDKMVGSVNFDAHVNLLSEFMRGYYQFEKPENIVRDYVHRLRDIWTRVDKDDTIISLTEKMFDTKLLP